MDKELLTALVLKARKGNRKVLEEIFRICHKPVYFLALKTVKNSDDAMDVVQETFLSVFQNIRKLKNEEAFFAWLCKITINKCKRFWEKQAGKMLSYDEDESIKEKMDTEEDFIPESVLDKAETRGMIMSIIDSLPDEQRISVVLFYYEGLKVEEIASVMECPVNTVKSRLFYARRQIKDGVEKFEAKAERFYGVASIPALSRLLEMSASENSMHEAQAQNLLSELLSNLLSSQGMNIVPNILNNIASLPLNQKIIAGAVSGVLALSAIAAPVVIHNANQKKTVGIEYETTAEETSRSTEIDAQIDITEESQDIPVNFADAEFEKCIRQILNRPDGLIYASDLLKIDELYIYGKSVKEITGSEYEPNFPMPDIREGPKYYDIDGTEYQGCGAITSLEDVKHFKNLKQLVICYNKISSISQLVELNNLVHVDLKRNMIVSTADLSPLNNLLTLCLDYNQISDLSGLKLPTGLKHLAMKGNEIRDITSLSGLTQLEGIDLSFNEIEDISALENMTRLRILILYLNKAKNLNALRNMPDLETVILHNNDINDISGLEGKTKLKTLFLSSNKITDIRPLSDMFLLETLNLRDNNVTDISPLKNNTSLKELDMVRNKLSNIHALGNLTNLEDLDLNENLIRDLSALENLTKLKKLILGFNKITDIASLSRLKNLEVLWLNANGVIDIRPLSGLTNLKVLYLISNNLTDISPLAGLTGLEELHIQDNIGITDFSPLAGLKNTKIERDYIKR